MNTILEYVWLDGYSTPNLRSKIKVIKDFSGEPPVWNFDGSSTNQAPGGRSECLLSPVRVYQQSTNHYFILCEVLNPDESPHETNTRSKLEKYREDFNDAGFWWGFEQEYFITENSRPLGFPSNGYPESQGKYYCGVGSNQVKARDLVEDHLHYCLNLGIELTGINAEVAIGQWEYQCFSKDTLKACDDLWMSRYILLKLAETKGYDIDISPKPVSGDWNGSGCHTNFSTNNMRDLGGKGLFIDIIENFGINHNNHILEYGEDNNKRLTGHHETQRVDKFSWGVADRGASMRIPTSVAKLGWRGYIEDRRPASNCDPYRVSRSIIETTLFLR